MHDDEDDESAAVPAVLDLTARPNMYVRDAFFCRSSGAGGSYRKTLPGYSNTESNPNFVPVGGDWRKRVQSIRKG